MPVVAAGASTLDRQAAASRRRALVRPVASLLLLAALAAVLPLGLRAVNAFTATGKQPESYLPSAFAPGPRRPFVGSAVEGLRNVNPAYLVIGDSMAGTRVDHRYLAKLTGRLVVPIYEPASASAYWYLAYKNWVVASGIRPRAVIFYFRDWMLTDPMFRLNPQHLDRVALQREPELDRIVAQHAQGTFFRVHAWLRDAYQYDRVRAWLLPLLERAPVALAASRPKARRELLDRMNNEIFNLEGLREMAAADIGEADLERLDFDRNLPRSVLPELLKLARENSTRLAFIRVQRRPEGNRPPRQSPELQEYTRKLKQYLEANGAYFHDEWGDPELPLSIYRDGDHIRRDKEKHTTELLVRRNPGLFQ
ncbi:MAG TPA: hypothetical protein PKK95_03625 [Vicinamibacterales bacterium]|nr:hypothetical protein [Vicinamibacterales bacterium]